MISFEAAFLFIRIHTRLAERAAKHFFVIFFRHIFEGAEGGAKFFLALFHFIEGVAPTGGLVYMFNENFRKK